MKEIGDFVSYLVERVRLRSRGLDVRGRSVGAANELLQNKTHLLRKVGDLCQLQAVQHASCLIHVRNAATELASLGIIPESAVVSCLSVRAAYDAVRGMPGELSNAELFRRLSKVAEENRVVKSYAGLVSRVWLLAAPESVVESMGNVVQDVFGHHRQLSHENAARELFIRWNGPDVTAADPLLQRVQAKYGNKFVRTDDRSIAASVLGTVLRRHQAKRCPRAAFFEG